MEGARKEERTEGRQRGREEEVKIKEDMSERRKGNCWEG